MEAPLQSLAGTAAVASTAAPAEASPAGTAQSVVDAAPRDHPPELYRHSSIGADFGRLPASDAELAAAANAFRRDGFVCFGSAFGPEAVAEQGMALQAIVDGGNAEFGAAFRRVYDSGVLPDFTSGQKIPWLQYESGTAVAGPSATAPPSAEGIEEKGKPPPSVLDPSLASRVRKIMGFHGLSRSLDAAADDPALRRLVMALLGEGAADTELELFQDMALLKPAGCGREKPWHQDQAYFNLGCDERVVGAWIAVDAATLDNGCMRFQRGGHLDGPRPHFKVRDYQLCDSEAPSMSCDGGGRAGAADDVVACPLPAGGLVVFDGMIPHGTPTNRSPEPRRALQFHWARKGAARVDPDSKTGRVTVFGGAPRGLTC